MLYCFTGGAGGKGVWGKPGLELEETGECSDIRDPNYDSDSEVKKRTVFSSSYIYKQKDLPSGLAVVLH